MDWRERLSNPAMFSEENARDMAARRIMRSMGAKVTDIGKMCRRLGIDYIEDEGSFERAVKIFREVYSTAHFIDSFDVKNDCSLDEIEEFLFSNNSTVILFFRKDRNSEMTALIKSPGLCTSPLGSLVMKPGMSYIASRGELQLWRQDPVKLLQSFSTREHEKEK